MIAATSQVPFVPFALERWQSDYELDVEFNLADSGVAPVTCADILTPDSMRSLSDLPLHYPEVRGTAALRTRIAALYGSAEPDDVLVTVGASEANAITVQTLVTPGDEVVVIDPNYQQVAGLSLMRGAEVRRVPMDPDAGWRLGLDRLAEAITARTRLVYVSNPNNPTGTVLPPAAIDALAELTQEHGVWLLADEVYRGSERSADPETPSLWGRHEKVISVGSMSKAYALSGLRIGWLLANASSLQELWRRHEYATITAGAADMLLATAALSEPVRGDLIRRNRALVGSGWRILSSWVEDHSDLVSVVPSDATGLAFVRYATDIPSVALADRLRREVSVLVAPGEHLGLEKHLRINHGMQPDRLKEALARIAGVLRTQVT